MDTYYCVEPAWVADYGKPRTAYKHLVPKTDELLFPHVDSCMAIAFVLEDDRMVGGHVSFQWDEFGEPNEEMNVAAMVAEMKQLYDNAKVKILITHGGPKTVAMIRASVKPENHLNWTNHIVGGSNLSLNGPQGTVSVCSYRTSQVVRTTRFSEIAGIQTNEIVYDAPVLFKVAEDVKNRFRKNVSKNSITYIFDPKYLSASLPEDALVDTFHRIVDALGECSRFDAPLSNALEGSVVYHFPEGQKLTVKLKVKLNDKNQPKITGIEFSAFEPLPEKQPTFVMGLVTRH